MVKFILENYSKHKLLELVKLCQFEYGMKAPSKSAIDRFLKMVKIHFKDDLKVI